MKSILESAWLRVQYLLTQWALDAQLHTADGISRATVFVQGPLQRHLTDHALQILQANVFWFGDLRLAQPAFLLKAP